MKNSLKTFLLAATLVAATVLWKSHSVDSSAGVSSQTETQSSFVSDKNEKVEKPKTPQLNSSMPKAPVRSELLSNESLKIFSQLDNAVDLQTGIEMFEQTGLDTPSNYLKAKESILKGIPGDPANRDDIRDRVIALDFIKYTQQVSWADCDDLLRGIASLSQSTLSDLQALNLKMDLLSVSRSCIRRFSVDRVDNLFQSVPLHESFKAQIVLALKPEGVQR